MEKEEKVNLTISYIKKNDIFEPTLFIDGKEITDVKEITNIWYILRSTCDYLFDKYTPKYNPKTKQYESK